MIVALVDSKDVLVSLTASNAYTTLDQAIQALLSDQSLVDLNNTVTVDSSCLSTPLNFPNTQIYGTTTGYGSITLSYSGLSSSITDQTDCNLLPTIITNSSSPILLSSMTSVSFSGFNIIYSGSGQFSAIYNLETVDFSNICFNNTEDSALSSTSGNAFIIASVSSLSMTNMIYFFDSNKQLFIQQVSQIIVSQITLIITSGTIDSDNAAFYINNDQYYNTNTNISNIEIVCQADLPLMPMLLWTFETNNTWISSLNMTNCAFDTTGTINPALFISACSNQISFDGVFIQNMTASYGLYHDFLLVDGVSSAIINNFIIMQSTFQFITFINISDTVSCSGYYPTQISVSNLSVDTCSFDDGAIFSINIQDYTHFRAMTMQGAAIAKTNLYHYSFIDYSFPAYIGNSLDTDFIYFKVQSLNITDCQIATTNLVYLYLSEGYRKRGLPKNGKTC